MMAWLRRLVGGDDGDDEVCIHDPEPAVERQADDASERARAVMAQADEQTRVANVVLRQSRNAIASVMGGRSGEGR